MGKHVIRYTRAIPCPAAFNKGSQSHPDRESMPGKGRAFSKIRANSLKR